MMCTNMGTETGLRISKARKSNPNPYYHVHEVYYNGETYVKTIQKNHYFQIFIHRFYFYRLLIIEMFYIRI